MGLPWWLSGKNLPVMQKTQETQVGSLGWEEPLEEGMATHSTIAWRIPWTEEPGGATVHGVAELDTTEMTGHTHTILTEGDSLI